MGKKKKREKRNRKKEKKGSRGLGVKILSACKNFGFRACKTKK